MKQLIPELLILLLVGANLMATCYGHHRIQERLNDMSRIGIPSQTLAPIELVPQREQNEKITYQFILL